jgi:PAS domain S-box-containing protein
MRLKKAPGSKDLNMENSLIEVINRIGDGVIAIDKNGLFIYANQKAAEIFELKNTNDLIGICIWTEFPEKTSKLIYPACQRALDNQEPIVIEDYIENNNKYFEYRIFPSKDGITINIIDITKSKKNELTLLEQQEHLWNMFTNHCSIMLVINPETGAIVDANLAAANFYGFPISRLREMNIKEINIQWPSIGDAFNQITHNRKHQFVFDHKLANGEIRTVEIHSSAFNSGSKTLLFSIVNDITERKKTEDALLRTQFTVDQTREEVFWINSLGKIIYANDSVCSVLGYSKEELSQMTIFGVDPTITVDSWPGHWKKTVGKKAFIFETVHKTKEGKIIPVEVSVSAMDFNGEIIHSSYARDITERKIIEQNLENEHHLLRTLIDNLPSPVFVKDKDYRKVLFNPIYAASVAGHLRSLGLDFKTEILGKTDFEIYPKEIAEEYFIEDQQVIRDGQLKLYEEKLEIGPEGKLIWRLVSKLPLRDKSGAINGMVGITFDISKQKLTEEALKKTQEELININRAQQMLSKCNKILVRTNEENKLLNEICRIIVEVGQYSFAWVGYNKNDETGKVRLAAQAGADKDFLKHFISTWDKNDLEFGIYDKTIHSGKSVIFNNTLKRQESSLWYTEALVHGYPSVISLPLNYKDKSYGVLNVYSSQPNAFHDSETSLLNELAEDLVFGIVTLRDQAKRIQAEEALQTSEDRFQQAIRVSNIGIFDHNHITNKIYWSEHQREMYGWSLDEPVTLPKYFKCIYSEDKDYIMTAVQRSHDPSSDGRFDVEHRIISRDGSVKWLTMRSQTYFSDDGDGPHPVRTVGATLDITKSKLAEQELKKLYVAIEQSPASVVITNIKGEIEYANAMFTKMSGLSLSDSFGKQLNILKKSKNINGISPKIWDKILKGQEWKDEYYTKNKNGMNYWESTSISPILNYEGEITNFLAIQEDVTEKKKTLEELILAKEKAEEANRVKDVFLANMSHELRTPLIVVLGYSQLLLEVSNDPDTSEMATGIRKGGIRLLNTLNSILDLTRIESVRFELDLKIVNLVEEIKIVFESFQEAVAEKKLDYSMQVLNDKLLANTDQRIFSHILKNIINNAVKFTNEGNIVVICGLGKDKMIYVTVKDTGIGIEKDHHELIFKEFHQVSEGINREYQGLGLGLAITKKYVEILGGKISVESELGAGSSFTICFPPALK